MNAALGMQRDDERLERLLALMNTCGSLQYHQQRYTTGICEEVH